VGAVEPEQRSTASPAKAAIPRRRPGAATGSDLVEELESGRV